MSLRAYRKTKTKCGNMSLPVLIGSGVTLDNVDNYVNAVDALIVGSHLKMGSRWENALDPLRVRIFVEHLKSQ